MSLRRLLVLSLLGLMSQGCGQAELPESARPNVLFIAVDDLRPELGAYGNPHIQTPNIDRLAESGVTFLQAHVQQAVCNPSRASLMTGLRPDSLRVWDLATDFRHTVPDVVTLPQHFMRNGYHAVAIGKIYHNTIPDSLSWSEPKLHIDGYPFDPDAVYRHPDNVAIQEERKAEIIEAGEAARYIDQYGKWYLKAASTEAVPGADDLYYDGAQTDVAIEKLAELASGDRPFFFAVGYYRPHLPFNAPQKYWDLYDPAAIPPAENSAVPLGGAADGDQQHARAARLLGLPRRPASVRRERVGGRRAPAEARLLRLGQLRGRAGRSAARRAGRPGPDRQHHRGPVGRPRVEAGRARQLGQDDQLRDRHAGAADRARAGGRGAVRRSSGWSSSWTSTRRWPSWPGSRVPEHLQGISLVAVDGRPGPSLEVGRVQPVPARGDLDRPGRNRVHGVRHSDGAVPLRDLDQLGDGETTWPASCTTTSDPEENVNLAGPAGARRDAGGAGGNPARRLARGSSC